MASRYCILINVAIGVWYGENTIKVIAYDIFYQIPKRLELHQNWVRVLKLSKTEFKISSLIIVLGKTLLNSRRPDC